MVLNCKIKTQSQNRLKRAHIALHTLEREHRNENTFLNSTPRQITKIGFIISMEECTILVFFIYLRYIMLCISN